MVQRNFDVRRNPDRPLFLGGLLRKRNFALLDECFKDIEFMIDQVLAGALGKLTAMCDFKNIGIIGHSLGGVMASHVCSRDARVKAGISLDGPLFGLHDATTPFNKPFLFLLRPNFYEYFNRNSADENEYSLKSLCANPESFIGSIEKFCRANGKDTFKIVVPGAEHNTFSDIPILVDFFTKMFGPSADTSSLEAGKVSPAALNAIRGSIIVFFNRYLKGIPTPYPPLVRHNPGHEAFDFYIASKAQNAGCCTRFLNWLRSF